MNKTYGPLVIALADCGSRTIAVAQVSAVLRNAKFGGKVSILSPDHLLFQNFQNFEFLAIIFCLR